MSYAEKFNYSQNGAELYFTKFEHPVQRINLTNEVMGMRGIAVAKAWHSSRKRGIEVALSVAQRSHNRGIEVANPSEESPTKSSNLSELFIVAKVSKSF